MALSGNTLDLRGPVAKENLDALEVNDWPLYRKNVPTRAMRVVGPFEVLTSEGRLACEDGWLCVDARGYPYPVADDEFQLIYVRESPSDGPLELRQEALKTLGSLANSNDPNVKYMAAKTILEHTGGT